jgi:hypothetical protein
VNLIAILPYAAVVAVDGGYGIMNGMHIIITTTAIIAATTIIAIITITIVSSACTLDGQQQHEQQHNHDAIQGARDESWLMLVLSFCSASFHRSSFGPLDDPVWYLICEESWLCRFIFSSL